MPRRVREGGAVRSPSPDAPLRVLLLSKTLTPARSGAFRTATAPWALGAFSLRRYVETLPDLARHVQISVRSYPCDAPTELILHEILSAAPEVVGFTCQPWNYGDHRRLSRLIKRLMPDIEVWHGGPMIVDRARYLAQMGPETVDVIAEGEGEHIFADLLAHRVFGAPALDSIGGIGWFDEDGTAHLTDHRTNPDVALLPPVITEENLSAMGSFVLYETTRGCPFRCSFCNWGSQKAKLRTRDRAVIEQDLRAILSRPEVTHLWLTDAGLDISTEHVLFLADCIRRYRRHPVHVSGYVFLLHSDLDYVSHLVGAFDTLQLGLQTANENILSEMGRKALSVQRFDRILDAVIPHYPDLRVDLIYGLPGIGLEELVRSVRFLLDKGIWLMNLYRLVAIPGTELGEHREKYGVVADDDFPFTVYGSEGCTLGDLFEMQQFKENMDTLRAMFLRGTYARAKAAGLDLVDFARRVHELVPRFNYRTDYGLEMDRELDADLVDALLAAADRYAERADHKALLRELITDAYGEAHASRPEPTRLERPRRRAGIPPPAPSMRVAAPSAALRGLTGAFSAIAGAFRTPITPERARAAWIEHEADPARIADVGVHVHVPFCTSICTFCDCATEALREREQVARYLDYIASELAYFDGVVTRELDCMYVGGGTPNLLTEDELDRLLTLVLRHHRFRPDAVRCIEGHPIHSSRAKLDVLRAHAVNRVSFGVQSRDPRVLKSVNRADQTPAIVERAVRDAFDAGIIEVNLDFIHGLADEPPESTFDAVTWGVSLAPTTVCLQLLNHSDYASPYTDEGHRQRVAREFRVLAARLAEWVSTHAPEYAVDFRPDTVAIHRHDMWRHWFSHPEYFAGRDYTRRSTLGYGRNAQSRLFGRFAYQNQERRGLFQPTEPIYAARPNSPALECMAELVAEIERARVVSLGALRGAHGELAITTLAPMLAELARAGHIDMGLGGQGAARRPGASSVDMDEEWLRDIALSPEAVTWVTRQLLPSEHVETTTDALVGSIRVTERDSAWRIRLERTRPGSRYFGVARSLGVYYQADDGVRLDATRTSHIMQAVVKRAEDLLAGGVAEAELARELAAFLDARLSVRGIHAKAESLQPKRHRLTVVAP